MNKKAQRKFVLVHTVDLAMKSIIHTANGVSKTGSGSSRGQGLATNL